MRRKLLLTVLLGMSLTCLTACNKEDAYTDVTTEEMSAFEYVAETNTTRV